MERKEKINFNDSNPIVDFDQIDYFENEIATRLNEIKILCNRGRIPFFFTACVKNDKKNSIYKSSMIGTARFPMKLANDKITKCLAIMAGFDAIPPKKVEIENVEDAIDSKIEEIESTNDFFEEIYDVESKTNQDDAYRMPPDDKPWFDAGE